MAATAGWQESSDIIPDELQTLLEKMIKASLTSRPKHGIEYFADYLESELMERTLHEMQQSYKEDEDWKPPASHRHKKGLTKKPVRKSKCAREWKEKGFVHPYAEQYECIELCPFHHSCREGSQDEGAWGENHEGEQQEQVECPFKPHRQPKRCGRMPEYFRIRREQKKCMEAMKKGKSKTSSIRSGGSEEGMEAGDQPEDDQGCQAMLKEYNDCGLARLIDEDNSCRQPGEGELEEESITAEAEVYGPHPGSHNIMYARKRPLPTDVEDKAIQCDSDMEPGDIGYIILEDEQAEILSQLSGEEGEVCVDKVIGVKVICDTEDFPAKYSARDHPDEEIRFGEDEGSPDGDDMPAAYPAPSRIHDPFEEPVVGPLDGSGECTQVIVEPSDCPAVYPRADEPDPVPDYIGKAPSRIETDVEEEASYPDPDSPDVYDENEEQPTTFPSPDLAYTLDAEETARYAEPDFAEGDEDEAESPYPAPDAREGDEAETEAGYPTGDFAEGESGEEEAGYPAGDTHEGDSAEEEAGFPEKDFAEGDSAEEEAGYPDGDAAEGDDAEEESNFPLGDPAAEEEEDDQESLYAEGDHGETDPLPQLDGGSTAGDADHPDNPPA